MLTLTLGEMMGQQQHFGRVWPMAVSSTLWSWNRFCTARDDPLTADRLQLIKKPY
jgi:hypothetical protein